MPRTLTPTEKTHLARYAPQALNSIDQYGETPVEYISGVAEFCGLLFTVTPDVLIPRLETEELVELAYQHTNQLLNGSTAKQLHICEIGTGCGAVAIVLTQKLHSYCHPEFSSGSSEIQSLTDDPSSTLRMTKILITATDVSEPAIEIAKLNSEKLLSNDSLVTHNVPSTTYEVQFLVSDLFSQVPSDQVYDLIIANLPYIPSDRINSLDPSVKDYEPHLALDGGSEGLTLIKKMIQQAEARTKPGSVILLEVDYTHTTNEFDEFLTNWKIETIIDQFHRQRFVKLTK